MHVPLSFIVFLLKIIMTFSLLCNNNGKGINVFITTYFSILQLMVI